MKIKGITLNKTYRHRTTGVPLVVLDTTTRYTEHGVASGKVLIRYTPTQKVDFVHPNQITT